jgi:dTDP-4-amino-4,6-dideoxygalactose transaminase
LQAAVLRVKLPHLDADNAARTRLANQYDEALTGIGLTLPRRSPETASVYHLYVIRSPRRDDLQAFLKSRGIGALVHYPVPIHLQPAYKGRLRASDNLPQSERAAREVLSLPIYPELDETELQKVISEVQAFQGAHND